MVVKTLIADLDGMLLAEGSACERMRMCVVCVCVAKHDARMSPGYINSNIRDPTRGELHRGDGAGAGSHHGDGASDIEVIEVGTVQGGLGLESGGCPVHVSHGERVKRECQFTVFSNFRTHIAIWTGLDIALGRC